MFYIQFLVKSIDIIVCLCVCVYARVRSCVRACVRACMRTRVQGMFYVNDLEGVRGYVRTSLLFYLFYIGYAHSCR